MRVRLVAGSVLFLGVFGSMVACGGKKPPPKEPNITETVADAGAEEDAAPEAEAPPAPKSLIDRLGGRDGVAKVVDTFVKDIQADNKVNKRFAKLKGDKLEKFKSSLTDQICEAASPPENPVCKYSGKSMKDAHKGMHISEAEWNAVVLDLKAAMEENKVGDTEQSDLISLLAPMKDDIVTPKKGAKK